MQVEQDGLAAEPAAPFRHPDSDDNGAAAIGLFRRLLVDEGHDNGQLAVNAPIMALHKARYTAAKVAPVVMTINHLSWG